jgi:hypothetical protein
MFQTIMTAVIPVLAVVIVGFVLNIIRFLSSRLAAKYHLQWMLSYESKVEELVTTGIKAVENVSLNAVKLGRDPTPGEQKLKDVLEFVTNTLAANKLPEKAGTELAILVESKLFSGLSAIPDPVVDPPVDPPVPVVVVDPPVAPVTPVLPLVAPNKK